MNPLLPVSENIFWNYDIFLEISTHMKARALIMFRATCQYAYHMLMPKHKIWPTLASRRGIVMEEEGHGQTKQISRNYSKYNDIEWARAFHYSESSSFSKCWHVYLLSKEGLRNNLKQTCDCDVCSYSTLWHCLSPGCEFTGCSRFEGKHAVDHSNKFQGHYIVGNGNNKTKQMRYWCYLCHKWIMKEEFHFDIAHAWNEPQRNVVGEKKNT